MMLLRFAVLLLAGALLWACARPELVRDQALRQELAAIDALVAGDDRFAITARQAEPHSGEDLLFIEYRPENAGPDSPWILITAGLHGDEPAGYLAAKSLLEDLADRKASSALMAARIDIAPMLNPWGYMHHWRRNAEDADLNRDFGPDKQAESGFLMRVIKGRGYDLALDLHESSDDNGFMIFGYLGSPDAAPVVAALQAQGFAISTNRHNSRYKDGIEMLATPSAGKTKSLSQYMIAVAGVPASWTLESPDVWPMQDRIRLHRQAIDAFAARFASGR